MWIAFVALVTYENVKWKFGREELRIDANGLAFLRIEGLVRRRRTIPFAEIRRITQYRLMVSGRDDPSLYPEYGVAIETIGRPICIGQTHDREAVNRLVADLEEQLREWYPTWMPGPPCADCEVLDASSTLPEPPSDSAIRCHRELDRAEFFSSVPARFSPLRAACPAVIWLFLMTVSLWSKDVTFRVSVLAAGGVGLVVSSPVRRRWVIRPGEITVFHGRWKIGRLRTIEIEWLDRMELLRLPSRTSWDASFELALVDNEGKDTASFGPMTEGEARWMAGIVAEVLRDALPRSGQQIYRWSVRADRPTAGSRAMADAWLDGGLDGPPDKTPRSGEE